MGNIVTRVIEKQVEKDLFKGRVIIIYGARQVGKTTLIKKIQNQHPKDSLYLNCDEPEIRNKLTETTSTNLKDFIKNKKLVFFDEAQRVKNIGLTLKLLVDNYPEIQLVATGSSSFDLSNKISEPLTGRKYEFYLYPFSLGEIEKNYETFEMDRLLESRIIYGMYPDVVLDNVENKRKLKEIIKSYLYQDIFQYQLIKNPEILEKLLLALALQIGSEVSYNELANLLNIDKKTIQRYIELLEKAFVIFRLKPYSKNLRNELSKLRKIYFWDTGVRNALINNFNDFNLRTDVGALWENFMISERLKNNNNLNLGQRSYFWRTHQQQEIDYLEIGEGENKISAFEFKWGKKIAKIPNIFSTTYPNSHFQTINKENFKQFLGIGEK